MDSGRMETVPPGGVHLDTVRALHQTVVSLRTALEISKNELKELKQKYEQHSHCIDYAEVIEKLTLENHILRRKIIDSGGDEKDSSTQNIQLEVTYSPRSQTVDYDASDIVIKTATDISSAKLESDFEETEEDNNNNFCSTDKLHEIQEQLKSPKVDITAEIISPHNNTYKSHKEEDSLVTSYPKQETKEQHHPSLKTKLELLSKFDVRIKVRTLTEGTVLSSTTSDSDSTIEDNKEKDIEKETTDSRASFHFEEKREHLENTEDRKGNKVNLRTISSENIKMAVPNEVDAKSKADKFDVQVRITSEENLEVKENIERSRRKDTLNLDVDDLSLRSMSEGDNSVFSEGGTIPNDPNAPGGTDDKNEQENTSGNESEEVDDIELIFTTDESKDMSNLQEDLVSIRETETWCPSSTSTTHSTPVLIKFHTLDPDFQPRVETSDNADNENQENTSLQGTIAESSLKIKRVSLPNDKEIRHVAFNGKGSLDLPGRGILKSYDNKSDNMLYRRSPNTSTRRLDSVDSLTCEYNRGLSFDNTKSSSFELGSSMDILHREESMDSFRTGHLGHRFSVFAETDISKCGISEEDLAANLNMRRNTCPNPFQYRPSAYRGLYRPPGPFKATLPPGRPRPVLREGTNPRRESGAQTDLSALPPRWSSDGYLAYKAAAPSWSATVPTRPPRSPAPVPPPRRAPQPPRTDETRRVLLSDIGFTSMVPELSRSADPVWALGKRVSATDPDSTTTSTSKFLSRGSSYRSPSLSIERSSDWIPQTVYAPNTKARGRAWRSSLPDVRRDDTDELLEEAETYLRRSIDNLRSTSLDLETSRGQVGQPYIPAEPRHLRLGHTVKVITPQGRIAVGRVRYVGIAGASAATSSVVVGAEFPLVSHPFLPRNDGIHKGRRYFLTPTTHTALFVPFSKVVMAWSN